MRIILPWPPTANLYYRHVGSRVLLSEDGRKYREAVGWVMLEAGRPKVEGRIKMELVAYPPDLRTRDLDNLFKSLLDSLQHAGLYESDSQIDYLSIQRGPSRRPALIEAHITPMEDA